jgi:hypothetical protein
MRITARATRRTHANLAVRLPLRESGVDKSGVIEILEASGVGLPDYYRWRSRSGCTFCFYQQKIEWVRLMTEHPKAFEEAEAYEKNAVEHGSPFTWSQANPSRRWRVLSVMRKYAPITKGASNACVTRSGQTRLRAVHKMMDIDDIYGQTKACIACHKGSSNISPSLEKGLQGARPHPRLPTASHFSILDLPYKKWRAIPYERLRRWLWAGTNRGVSRMSSNGKPCG